MTMDFTTTQVLIIFKIIVTFFSLLGLVALSLELFDFPSGTVRKNLSVLSHNTSVSPGMLSKAVQFISLKIQKLISIDELKRKKMISEFDILGIKITPEEYYGNAISKGILCGLISPFGFIVHPALGIFILLVAVILGMLEISNVDRIIKKRREDIEKELPRFVSVINQVFKNDRDVIKLITSYIETGETPLTRELKITLADMKTGNFEMAINKMSNRVNSVYLSETMRGLISALRGDDTVSYFETLNTKLWEIERARIRKAAMKTPSKVKYLVTTMLTSMMLIYIVVFGTVIIEGLGDIFKMM